MKNILILSASVGAGHVSAARALEETLKRHYPNVYVKNVDVLDLTNAAFRHLYAKVYLDLINKAPLLLGYFYDLLDKPVRYNNLVDRLRYLAQKINLREISGLLRERNWDAVLNTHFLPAEIIAHMRKRGKIRIPQFTITTDFQTHRLWLNEPCEHYFTATPESAAYLEQLGIPRKKISVTGIPVHPDFGLKNHRPSSGRPTILQLAGGFGVGPIEAIFQNLLAVKEPSTIVVVTGKNEKVRHKLLSVRKPARHRVKIVGFTTEMASFMAQADLVVTKPGGLTTSEALACGLPLLIINPVPGQETLNSDYLLENGAAIKAHRPSMITYKVEDLLKNRGKLVRLQKNARLLGRPDAALKIIQKVLHT